MYYPTIAIVTPTKNRSKHMAFQAAQLQSQSYPLGKIIWIVTDSSDSLDMPDTGGMWLIWKRLPPETLFGKSRNESLKLALETGAEFIFFMDDDDIIHKERFTYTVKMMLENPSYLIAGSSRVILFLMKDQDLVQTCHLHDRHVIEPYMCVRREYAMNHSFDDNDRCAFLVPFLNDFTEPVLQLDPKNICVMIGHDRNTINKYQMKDSPRRYGVESIEKYELEHLFNDWSVSEDNRRLFMAPYT